MATSYLVPSIRGRKGEWYVGYRSSLTGDWKETVDSYTNRGHAVARYNGMMRQARGQSTCRPIGWADREPLAIGPVRCGEDRTMDYATWTDSDLRAVCRRNDPNGDWTDASRAYMVECIARWHAEEPTFRP